MPTRKEKIIQLLTIIEELPTRRINYVLNFDTEDSSKALLRLFREGFLKRVRSLTRIKNNSFIQ